MEHLIIWTLVALLLFMCFGALYGAGSFIAATLRNVFRTPRD
ncbi:hypothetical protein [Marinobacterium iners]|uniref:Uncharacterized protein n=1 Tax=Marinobacterium iners DSM 11526 TaxID=1122198 RepID=A0A1H3ZXS8_9GAMM|nr:hypothetical protein [Marinobacterium iners]SEA28455.1 hypothetical protein SAMN02745729_102204 [Marinobacterium iners DSM 11526]